MDVQPPRKIRFDAWTLDTQSGDLSKGEVTTRLQIQPLQVLLALLENAGNLVTREQLIARLWPKGIVEFDTSLNTAVRKLRIALNDDSDNPRYIETIPRRGYRFVAAVREIVAAAEAANRGVAQTSLAVLPFRSLSAAARDEWLELGLAETLITRLSQIRQLRVRSLASSEHLEQSVLQDPDAAGRLVAHEADYSMRSRTS